MSDAFHMLLWNQYSAGPEHFTPFTIDLSYVERGMEFTFLVKSYSVVCGIVERFQLEYMPFYQPHEDWIVTVWKPSAVEQILFELELAVLVAPCPMKRPIHRMSMEDMPSTLSQPHFRWTFGTF